jgi:hypothetical protein
MNSFVGALSASHLNNNVNDSRSPMERRIHRRRHHLQHHDSLLDGHTASTTPTHLYQRSQSYKELRADLGDSAHSADTGGAGRPLPGYTTAPFDMLKDPESVTRWTSQILAQIDSLPNLEQIGLDTGNNGQWRAPPSVHSTATSKYASKSVVCI